jgi:hypothetical protein
VANFRHLATKKKGGASKSKKGIFQNFKNSPYHEEKNIEVARFKQCVPSGSHN